MKTVELIVMDKDVEFFERLDKDGAARMELDVGRGHDGKLYAMLRQVRFEYEGGLNIELAVKDDDRIGG